MLVLRDSTTSYGDTVLYTVVDDPSPPLATPQPETDYVLLWVLIILAAVAAVVMRLTRRIG